MAARILELDFGMGNIRSLQKALEHLGAFVSVIQHAEEATSADAIVLPGDGAFGTAMDELERRGFIHFLRDQFEKGTPILGVCIGFQLLFQESTEFGEKKGIGFVPGKIDRFSVTPGMTIPHMGWTQTRIVADDPLWSGIDDASWFYYVHSYRFAGIHPYAIGSALYGQEFTSALRYKNLAAVQFHPEKSHRTGLRLLGNFLNTL